MAGILHLMAAVLWNPKPRGDSYWVRLKHLTARGIHRKIPEYLYWYTHKRIRYQVTSEAIRKFEPSLRKIRWIPVRMHDYMTVERLGGGHCPYGVWVPHPSLFTLDGKPDFHLPPHQHVKAKHRYKSLGVRRSFTQKHSSDNQNST